MNPNNRRKGPLLTGPGGKTFGSSGSIVNYPGVMRLN